MSFRRRLLWILSVNRASTFLLKYLIRSFGVIRAFLDADLLPRVITGTSAGGVVAALLCTRTNEELKLLLVPKLADKITACEDSFLTWTRRLRQTGARFSSVEWARKVSFRDVLHGADG